MCRSGAGVGGLGSCVWGTAPFGCRGTIWSSGVGSIGQTCLVGVDCIVWDFGDTVADERWMQVAPTSWPAWAETYRSVVGDPDFAAAWNRGDATVDDLATRMCAASPLTEAEVLHHVEAICSQITLFPSVVAAIIAARGRVPQMCATINPDIFSRWVVPAHRLDELFDVIVTSWQEHTLSKVELAQAGLVQLNQPIALADTLLIDNRPDNIAEYRASGGTAYLFASAALFTEDLLDGALPPCLVRQD